MYDKNDEISVKLTKRLAEKLPAADPKELWYDTVELFSRKAEKFTAMPGADKTLCGMLSELGELCGERGFRIAFAGAPKSGRSSLINALIGRDLSSSGLTAATEYRGSSEPYVKVTFRDEPYLPGDAPDEWTGHEQITIPLYNDGEIRAELAKWSGQPSVKCIEVGVTDFPEYHPENLGLIDAPPLEGPPERRARIIKETADRANAVFVCIDARKIRRRDLETLSMMFDCCSHNKEKVYVVMTHWDRLYEPAADWVKLRQSLVRHLSAEAFFGSAEAAEKRILHAAAHIHNICRDFGRSELSGIIPAAQLAMNYYPPEVSVKMLTQPEELMPELMGLSNVDDISGLIDVQLPQEAGILLDREIGKRYGAVSSVLRGSGRRNGAAAGEIKDMPFGEFIEKAAEITMRRYERLFGSRDEKVTEEKLIPEVGNSDVWMEE